MLRIVLFLATNLAILVLLGIVMSVLGVDTRSTSGLLVMAAIFALPVFWFQILIAAILLGGSWEYQRLAGLSGHFSAYFLILLQVLIFVLLSQTTTVWSTTTWIYLGVSCGLWLLMFSRMLFYRPGTVVNTQYRISSFITALISISTAWFAVCWIRALPAGSWLILFLLIIVWASDIGAYFTGKAFGKRKLAANISPGKTVAGLVGGILAASLAAIAVAKLTPIPHLSIFHLILLSVSVALVSVGGDLLISMHKRISGFKDSGSILPGHGGILDRLDSTLAAAPFFALGLMVSGL